MLDGVMETLVLENQYKIVVPIFGAAYVSSVFVYHTQIKEMGTIIFVIHFTNRSLKRAGIVKINFLISQPNQVLCAFKRTASMRRFL